MPSPSTSPLSTRTERYEDFAAKQKQEAKSAFVAFMAGLAPEDAAALKLEGVTGYFDDHDHIGPPEDGGPAPVDADDRPADWETLSVEVDFAGRCDSLADELQEKYKIPFFVAFQMAQMIEDRINAEVERRKAEQLQTIAAFMIAPGNARKRALGLAYAANLDALNGLGSQEKAGKQTLSSRASINAETNKWRDLLGMPQNGHMKDDSAREVFSKEKSGGSHWRRKKFRHVKPKKAKAKR